MNQRNDDLLRLYDSIEQAPDEQIYAIMAMATMYRKWSRQYGDLAMTADLTSIIACCTDAISGRLDDPAGGAHPPVQPA